MKITEKEKETIHELVEQLATIKKTFIDMTNEFKSERKSAAGHIIEAQQALLKMT